jgi:hypothetical protein
MDCYEYAAPAIRRNLCRQRNALAACHLHSVVFQKSLTYILVRMDFFCTLMKFTYYYERTAIDLFKNITTVLRKIRLLLVHVLQYLPSAEYRLVWSRAPRET